MSRLIFLLALWLGLQLCTFSPMVLAVGNDPRSPQRALAVTFDDLPFVTRGGNGVALRELSAKLLQQINESGIPAVGFVNEGKLYPSGELDPQGVAILEDWLAAGLELGNHTYSHGSLNQMSLADFTRDVIRGEAVTRQLMMKHNMPLRYFRHPFLQVGKDAETRAAFEKFLVDHGYIIAPVTINHAEWVFAAAFDKAALQGDEAAMRRVAEAYIPYMEQVFVKTEQQSFSLFGYEIKQILLLHANALNAAYFGELAAMIKRRGYTFITLDAALQDRAYRSPNTFNGADGVSWLDQWSDTFGLRPQEGIKVPIFVRGLAGRAAISGY